MFGSAWASCANGFSLSAIVAQAREGKPTRRRAVQRLSRRDAVCLLALLGAVPHTRALAGAATDGPPLAIKGYDPVAYFTLGKPAAGLPAIEYEWDEQRYRFARPEHRDLFKADPVRYAPQFAGFCAAALTRGQVDEANPEYWLIS